MDSVKNQGYVLIVRPETRQVNDIKICQQQGWRALPFAPIQIDVLSESLIDLPKQMLLADVIFWVSPTAVEVAMQQLTDLQAIAKPHIAVGKATAQYLQAASADWVVHSDDGQDSEAVLALPIWKQLPRSASVLIVRGEGGRDWLARQLVQKGFNVTFAEIYQRVPKALDWHLFQLVKPNIAWVTSTQMARLLFEQVPAELAQQLRSLLYFTHHQRIAKVLNELGVEQVFCMPNLESALLSLTV